MSTQVALCEHAGRPRHAPWSRRPRRVPEGVGKGARPGNRRTAHGRGPAEGSAGQRQVHDGPRVPRAPRRRPRTFTCPVTTADAGSTPSSCPGRGPRWSWETSAGRASRPPRRWASCVGHQRARRAGPRARRAADQAQRHRQPAGPERAALPPGDPLHRHPLTATCTYAVYDPFTRTAPRPRRRRGRQRTVHRLGTRREPGHPLGRRRQGPVDRAAPAAAGLNSCVPQFRDEPRNVPLRTTVR